MARAAVTWRGAGNVPRTANNTNMNTHTHTHRHLYVVAHRAARSMLARNRHNTVAEHAGVKSAGRSKKKRSRLY
eukprot:351497-Chlamydomonas_euryale.AAC.3